MTRQHALDFDGYTYCDRNADALDAWKPEAFLALDADRNVTFNACPACRRELAECRARDASVIAAASTATN